MLNTVTKTSHVKAFWQGNMQTLYIPIYNLMVVAPINLQQVLFVLP